MELYSYRIQLVVRIEETPAKANANANANANAYANAYAYPSALGQSLSKLYILYITNSNINRFEVIDRLIIDILIYNDKANLAETTCS